jgi:hypothetical protein
MDVEGILKRVNWKTTGCAVAYIACNAIGGLVPTLESVCKVLDPLLIGLGVISAADAGRVQNVVAAVDTLLWKNKLDPETLRPIVPGVEGIGGEHPLPAAVVVTEKAGGV